MPIALALPPGLEWVILAVVLLVLAAPFLLVGAIIRADRRKRPPSE